MKTIQGDVITLAEDGFFDVIAQGCNCFCAMGAGLALSIRKRCTEAWEADKRTNKGDREKLGTCSVATCYRNGHLFDVVNAYTQYYWEGEGVLADYDAIESCMKLIKENYSGKRIGLPKIGSLRARGDWEKILKIIEKTLNNEDVTIVEYNENSQ